MNKNYSQLMVFIGLLLFSSLSSCFATTDQVKKNDQHLLLIDWATHIANCNKRNLGFLDERLSPHAYFQKKSLFQGINDTETLHRLCKLYQKQFYKNDSPYFPLCQKKEPAQCCVALENACQTACIKSVDRQNMVHQDLAGNTSQKLYLKKEGDKVGWYIAQGQCTRAISLNNIFDLAAIHTYFTGKDTARKIRIGIYEEGAQLIIHTHPFFNDNFNAPSMALHELKKIYDNSENERALMKVQKHATAVAGAIATIAPDAKMFGLGPNPEEENTSEQPLYLDMIDKLNIDELSSNEFMDHPKTTADILNFSVGFGSTSKEEECSFFFNNLGLDKLVDMGVLLVKAAGNEKCATSEQILKWAAEKAQGRMIVVGSLGYDSKGEPYLKKYSNFVPSKDFQKTPFPYLCAPGTDVLVPFQKDGYTSMSGTSFAAPVVSGALALLMEAVPEWKKTPEKYIQVLLLTADKDTTKDQACGYGFLNIKKALLFALQQSLLNEDLNIEEAKKRKEIIKALQ